MLDILRHGENVEVVESAELRKLNAARLAKAVGRYANQASEHSRAGSSFLEPDGRDHELVDGVGSTAKAFEVQLRLVEERSWAC